ncbi:hypothetical protein [Kitasatospora sp. MAA4]|uniref:hypothetical protein n=1 Tax=Kitasatospora sp. MAA4 TaxID=3035093 RepID=UPI002475959E|nr:hypothetical protein [Kitasatospora sp. MAA4]
MLEQQRRAEPVPVPVQRVFTLTRKDFNAGNIHTINRESVFAKAVGQQKSWPDGTKDDVWAQIQEMASSEENHQRFGSYEALINAALALHRAKLAKNLGTVTSTTIRTGALSSSNQSNESSNSSNPSDPSNSSDSGDQLSDQQKVERLSTLRREVSAIVPSALHDFRNRNQMVTSFKPLTGGSNSQNPYYTIGTGGNFLLGGTGTGHSYDDLVEKAVTHSGLKEEALAERLITYLGGNTKAFEGMDEAAVKQCLKMVALFQGAEFRRAAMNPLAAVAALNSVISSSGTVGISDAIYKSTLFGPTNGGSMQSQFHRNTGVDTTTEAFLKQAVAEYDNIARLLRRNGFDPNDLADFEKGCLSLAKTLTEAHQKTFDYEMEG